MIDIPTTEIDQVELVKRILNGLDPDNRKEAIQGYCVVCGERLPMTYGVYRQYYCGNDN
jgi:hypothetical protein